MKKILQNPFNHTTIFFFKKSNYSTKLAPERIAPETLRGARSKVPSQYHEANPSEFTANFY